MREIIESIGLGIPELWLIYHGGMIDKQRFGNGMRLCVLDSTTNTASPVAAAEGVRRVCGVTAVARATGIRAAPSIAGCRSGGVVVAQNIRRAGGRLP